MKVVINRCYGGFSISDECLALYNKLSGRDEKYDFEITRDDKHLIEAIEKIGEKEASGLRFSEIHIVDIPDGTEYSINEYDGMESVHERHHSWS